MSPTPPVDPPVASTKAVRLEHDGDCSSDQHGVRFSKMDDEEAEQMDEWDQILRGEDK